MRSDFLSIAPLQEKLEALSTLQRALLVVATLVILAGSFYFLKYKPQSERLQGLESKISQQEKRLSQLKKAASQIDTFREKLAASEEQLAELLALLPDEKEIPGLLDSISQLGAQVGLENVLFQPQPEQKHEFYAVIPVRLDLLGTYHELGVFYDKISKLNRILKVDSLNMTRQKDSSLLQVGCTIITYRFLEQPEPQNEANNNAKKKK